MALILVEAKSLKVSSNLGLRRREPLVSIPTFPRLENYFLHSLDFISSYFFRPNINPTWTEFNKTPPTRFPSIPPAY